jgi:AcrR family transcriptional regulator
VLSRPRTFDTEQALDQAMLVFWRLGYDRTTLSDLTAAMGINRPSLYAAFGNKEALFKKALDHYARGPAGYDRAALALPTAREVTEALLRGAADVQTRPDMPHGCLAILGAPTCGETSSPIATTLIEARRAGEAELRERFERARAEGDLPADVDPEELAGYIRTVAYGMAVKAATGATRAQLDRVVDHAMRAWPG